MAARVRVTGRRVVVASQVRARWLARPRRRAGRIDSSANIISRRCNVLI